MTWAVKIRLGSIISRGWERTILVIKDVIPANLDNVPDGWDSAVCGKRKRVDRLYDTILVPIQDTQFT